MLVIDPRERPSANRLLESIGILNDSPVAAATIPAPKTSGSTTTAKPFMPRLPIAEKITARNITFADLSPSSISSGRCALPSKSLSPTKNKAFAAIHQPAPRTSITPRDAVSSHSFINENTKYQLPSFKLRKIIVKIK